MGKIYLVTSEGKELDVELSKDSETLYSKYSRITILISLSIFFPFISKRCLAVNKGDYA